MDVSIAGITDGERGTIAEMMAKGTFAWIMLATTDLDKTFERVQASGAEIVQESTEQRPAGDRPMCGRQRPGSTGTTSSETPTHAVATWCCNGKGS
jgi:hypothetical protein